MIDSGSSVGKTPHAADQVPFAAPVVRSPPRAFSVKANFILLA